MSDSYHDALLRAFTAIAAVRGDPAPDYLASLNAALSETANRMRDAGHPVKRVVAHVKAVASQAGVRVSHDRLVTSAVLWAIDSYYRTGMEFGQPVDVAGVAAQLRTLMRADDVADVQPRLSGSSDRVSIARESRSATSSRHFSP